MTETYEQHARKLLAFPVAPLAELETLHASLNDSQRLELLECLLIAASKNGEALIAALDPWLLAAAGEDLLRQSEDDLSAT